MKGLYLVAAKGEHEAELVILEEDPHSWKVPHHVTTKDRLGAEVLVIFDEDPRDNVADPAMQLDFMTRIFECRPQLQSSK